MEHKPIVEKLLAHYKDVHGRVETLDSIGRIHYLLESTFTGYGICRCALHQFNTRIYSHDWVEKYGKFWGNLPMNEPKTEVLRCLQIRIDNLTKELELINDKQIVNN